MMKPICCPHCGHALSRPGLTAKMRELLDLIQATMASRKVPPTYAEMAAGMRLSKTRVFTLVSQLEERGYLLRNGGSKRQSLALVGAVP
jgi:SOS-response transcriptional repressor LexA